MLEVTQALCEVWGPARVGVRLSPSGTSNGMSDSTPRETFGHVIRELSGMRIAYAHVMEKLGSGPAPADDIPVSHFRPLFDGVLIANSAFTFEKARAYLREGWADAIAFGVLFIANPDLPERFARLGAGEHVPFNTPDASTFYAGGSKGYTDYPFLADSQTPAT
jgi:N-ethylmaleimide reductase